MSAMNRSQLSAFLSTGILSLSLLSTSTRVQGQDLSQHLRDEYEGKTFLLRGFPAGKQLRYDSSGFVPEYDSSGLPSNAVPGDWTSEGFVRVNTIHLSDDQLIIKAQRMAAAWLDTKQFELRPLEHAKGIGKEATVVEIKAVAGMHNPSLEQVDAVLSKIFLTTQDSLADVVPDYWRSCVSHGLKGEDKSCVFSPDILAVRGVSSSTTGGPQSTDASGDLSSEATLRVGKDGVSPPRAIHRPEPHFSEAARAARFQGSVILALVVSKEGAPTDIRISQPLGYGLDEKAVEAVEDWRFAPAEKDGHPVPVPIQVEVDFHLY